MRTPSVIKFNELFNATHAVSVPPIYQHFADLETPCEALRQKIALFQQKLAALAEPHVTVKTQKEYLKSMREDVFQASNTMDTIRQRYESIYVDLVDIGKMVDEPADIALWGCLAQLAQLVQMMGVLHQEAQTALLKKTKPTLEQQADKHHDPAVLNAC